MSSSSKVHVYPYTLKVAAIANLATICTNRVVFFLQPPEGSLTIEGLFIHLKMTFDASIPIGQRIIKQICIGDSFPVFGANPTYYRPIPLNIAADPTTRKIDIKLDMSSMLKKSNVGFMNGDFTISGTGTWVLLDFPDTLVSSANVGTMDLWKMDGLFTTKGTR